MVSHQNQLNISPYQKRPANKCDLLFPKFLRRLACNCATCLQLPGILSLSTKFLPTVMNMIKRLAEEGSGHTATTNGPQRNPTLASRSFHNGVDATSSEMSSSASSSLTETDNSSSSKQD